ncbi:MAG TPA: Ig-like domain-containing protein [Gaiellaceae bacterium]|jgi:predicted extracellular nuclease
MHPLAVVRVRARVLFGAVALALVLATFLVASAGAVSANLVVSQVYGGGGNASAPYLNDYIEVFNRGTGSVSLDGMSLQYASATGTGNFGANSAQLTELSGTLAPGQYLLVQQASGGTNGVPLPTPDIVDPTPINMSGTAGKVVIATGTTTLGCNGGSAPCDAAATARIVDLVGYGNANFFEGPGAAPTLSNTLAAFRGANGCADTDNNQADFAAAAPAPRNTASPFANCVADLAPTVTDTTPDDGATGVELDSNITVTFSEPVNVSGSWFAISCSSSLNHAATVSGGPTTFTLDPTTDFVTAESCSVALVGAQISDQDTDDPPDTVAGNPSWTFTTATPPVEIHEIQGAAHTSPLLGDAVSGVTGIVTAKRSNGFYFQDPTPDADSSTSEGLFVFTSSAPTVNVGDSVRVSGTVVEFRPGGASSANLTLTEIGGPTINVLSTGNPVPAPTVIGAGGRTPPTSVIDNDSFATFDPAQDGIDFYESLEAMSVQVDNPVVVGPRNNFGEIFVLADDGAGAGPRTARGGIVIQPDDFNPERIQFDDAILSNSTPNASVGDHFTGAAMGIVDYDFGNFEVNLTAPLTVVPGGLARETTGAPAGNELSVATYNVENLDANEPQSKFDAIAAQIVNNLRSPDILSLEEIQDNNGATNDSVVDANLTLDKLVNSIAGAGGPSYQYRQINPVDDADGGEPGGNIRVGFLFRTDRGVAFVDRPGGGSTNPTGIVNGPDGPELTFSPGRVDPANTAWEASRKPLAGEFTFRGEKFFLITNHFNSKGGDNPLFGRFQPPVRVTEVQRHQQAQIVNAFVDSIRALDTDANVIVLGDINDFEFSQTMELVEGGVMTALMKTLPQLERYSYVFEGNSQSLDHIVVTNNLLGKPFSYDAVHINAEFHDQLSDHDPQVARLLVNAAPTVDAGGPYTVAEGGSVSLTATGSDSDGDALTYSWDLDGNGSFETAGQSVVYTAGDGPASPTVRVQVSDGTSTGVDEATVNVTNVAPTATFVTPASSFAGFPFTIALTGASDPSAADTAAGFQYAFDCGSGYAAFGSASSASCATTDVGTRTVRGQIRDKDGGVTEYTATVAVVVTFDSLCDLVRAYSSKPAVSHAACALLAAAERARSPLARELLLIAFRVLVVASSGNKSIHAFTPTEGETLIRLSRSL